MNLDVIVIGSGIGGLTAAALLARYGKQVVVCESHAIASGAAHCFARCGFTFGLIIAPRFTAASATRAATIRCDIAVSPMRERSHLATASFKTDKPEMESTFQRGLNLRELQS